MSFLKKSLTNHSPLPKKPRLNFRILLNIRAYLLTHQGHHQRKGPPARPQNGRHSHLTAWSTRLSSGLRLGLLLEERMPVPQLLASVFLGEVQGRGVRPPDDESPQPLGLWRGPHRSKKEARRRRSRTLWRVPALTWQFMSCALVMYTLVPAGGGGERIARADQDTPHPNNSTHSCLLDTQERRDCPQHHESCGQILKLCVGHPWNHPHETTDLCPCGQNCRPMLIPASGVETFRQAFDSYQYEGVSGAPGPNPNGVAGGAEGRGEASPPVTSSSFSEGSPSS